MDRMTTDYSSARPPRWAETLLRLLLPPKDRESVSGDLLEEYRDTIVPALGPAAGRWYVRQVGSFLVRASWAWGAIVGAALVIRYLFDTLVPPTDFRMRATALTYTIIDYLPVGGLYRGVAHAVDACRCTDVAKCRCDGCALQHRRYRLDARRLARSGNA